jgi:Dna[CI] antecedent, DciA
MQNTRRLSELLGVPGKRLASLKQRSEERSSILAQVRAAVAPKLADAVSTAGLDDGRLTVGVVSAVWASRLRYCSELIRARVSESSGFPIQKVRIRVVPPQTA